MFLSHYFLDSSAYTEIKDAAALPHEIECQTAPRIRRLRDVHDLHGVPAGDSSAYTEIKGQWP